eukprot:931478-Pleurochrysis_carterae.AAC.1
MHGQDVQAHRRDTGHDDRPYADAHAQLLKRATDLHRDAAGEASVLPDVAIGPQNHPTRHVPAHHRPESPRKPRVPANGLEASIVRERSAQRTPDFVSSQGLLPDLE